MYVTPEALWLIVWSSWPIARRFVD